MAEAAGDIFGPNDAETGDLSQWTTTSVEGGNTLVADAAAALHGDEGFLLTYDGTNDSIVMEQSTDGDQTDIYLRAYWHFSSGFSWGSNSNWVSMVIRDGSTDLVYLRFFCTGTNITYGRLYYFDNSGSHFVSLSGTFSRDVDHSVEIHFHQGAGDGEIEAWIDEVSVGSASSLTNTNYAADSVRIQGQGLVPDSDDVVYVDDVLGSTTGPIGAYAEAGGVVPTPYYRTLMQGAA